MTDISFIVKFEIIIGIQYKELLTKSYISLKNFEAVRFDATQNTKGSRMSGDNSILICN